ncbi:MAG TPA: amidohydrolase family protein [Candidatus Ruania gallistercoris]|uniref:Amidohydrolase family protein n=1 Tax=Candidatus Ruania gallistercoris TaxID=2838746 RepID=A0A9D2J5Z8_9MICO|nr:amidohydrolase family protein [Candidatus Ruania gallistercoris]
MRTPAPLQRIEGARLLGPELSRQEQLVDLTLAGGRVQSVQPARGRTGSTAEGVLAAEGAWVMPGLWDAHTHPTDWAASRHRLDLSGCTDRAQVLAVVRAAVDARGTGDTDELVGTGLRHATWTQRPEVGLLDAVTGSVPTALISTDMHSAWFNSAALRHYQLTEPDEGLVAEGPWFAVMPQVGAADEERRDQWVIEAGRAAAALGVVGIADFDPGAGHAAWRRRVAAGFDAHRVQASVWADRMDEAIGAGLRTGDALPGGAGLVTMGRLKVISDGSLNTRTAWCHDPFTDGGQGAPNLTAAELTEVMARAAAAGIESSIHAIGDRAVTVALDAFARTGARGRIEHAQLVTDADVARMARLGVRASVQPGHTVDDRDLVDRLWADQAPRAYRFADLHRAGVALDLGSDAPVTPLDPWLAISAAVHRTDDHRPPWYPQQRLDLATALRASWGPVTEIRAGGPADLVLLDRHPDSLLAPDRARPRVLATLCAGRLTHH